MYGNYQVGLAVPQIHFKDGNAATPDVPLLPSYFDCRPEMIIYNYDLYTFMICK